jgi:hypothetical protein
MSLRVECPRCTSVVTDDGPGSVTGWRCAEHGSVVPLWRATPADYDGIAEHLIRSAGSPSLVPWPLPPGWAVTDFGFVGRPDHEPRASFVTSSGPSDLDGVVEVTVLSEEPGVGLGARCSGVVASDPGAEVGDGPPHARVRIDGHPVPLWSVLTSDVDVDFDRSVFAGEAKGRWLWLVLRPASAALLLQHEWLLLDLGDLGPELIDLPFVETPPAW